MRIRYFKSAYLLKLEHEISYINELFLKYSGVNDDCKMLAVKSLLLTFLLLRKILILFIATQVQLFATFF